MSNPKCFLDANRECGQNCMAFVHTSMGDRLKQCGILVTGNKLFEVASLLLSEQETTHPKSAPPPKVET